ncbi:hypothetical protein ACFWIB_31735 [Streptomyces sp. NPDC127051]|uniref:hypothetical protein n=1 Tax=Streptomyces sp. NPDC127051 TaxID=3347119 RepID=UPI00365D8F20
MNHSANINHDAVLRARVALLGSAKPPVRERVAAYRVLVQVSPLAYLPLLSAALWKYSRYEFAHRPEIALALRAESVAAARGMYAMEPGWGDLLVTALTNHRELLILMDRQEELRAVEEEITRTVSGER